MQILDPAPELVVGGRYRLIEALARGGTASVWRAHDIEADRDVAIKVLRDEGVDPELRARAGREAKILVGIEHPNLVRVLDSGDDQDLPFMVMELLEGETLSRTVAQRGALPVEEAVALVADVADGLGAAHTRGVIHRDVKPSNIVCHEQVPVLVDFGIARNLDATTLTRGLVVGTAAYLSPEQAQGRPLTAACDVYALGCVLHELLTGKPPFEADSSVAVALMHVQQEPVPPADLADVPAAVNAVVVRCLAKDPARRPADGTALAAALRDALLSDPTDDTDARPLVLPDQTMVMPAMARDADLIDPAPLAPVPPPRPHRPRRQVKVTHGMLLVAALVALLLFGIAGAIAGGGNIGGTREVPDVTGATVAEATRYLEGVGLTVDVDNVPSPDHAAGIVIASDPAARATIADGGTVKLLVSTGPPPTTAPAAEEDEGDGDEDRGRGRDKPGKDDDD